MISDDEVTFQDKRKKLKATWSKEQEVAKLIEECRGELSIAYMRDTKRIEGILSSHMLRILEVME